MARIFISYRRKSSAFTLLLANQLSQQLDADIFVDFESIDETDFETAILKHLRQSDVFLLMVTEHTFADRIHNDADWVRKEIQIALERGIPIILVCENGLFPPSDLPNDIREIRNKQGIEFYPAYFDAAVTRLVKFLAKATTVQLKAVESEALAVPQEHLEEIVLEQSEVNDSNAQQILTDALTAYDNEDFAQALFLFEALKDIAYQTRIIDIDETIADVRKEHERQERKRQAEFEYDEIVLFAKSERTLPQALRAFEEWSKNHAEFVNELDTQGLRNKKIAPPPKPKTTIKSPAPRPPAKQKEFLKSQRATSSQQNKKPSNFNPIIAGAVLSGIIVITLFAMTMGAIFSTDTPLEQAEAGVAGNADWQPFVHDFGDSVEMMLVPVGCFMMGSNDGDNDEQPIHEICFEDPFWIDKTEITRAQYQQCVDAGECEETPDSDYSTEVNQPINMMTWFQANTYCESREGRLPTEAEWEYAARGPDGLIYPWGDEFIADNVVYNSNSDGITAVVGSHPEGASWVGALDMSGNVWEWTSTIYETEEFPYPYVSDDGRENVSSDSQRVLRGGSFRYSLVGLRAANRNGFTPGSSNLYDGVRCARSY